MTAFARCVELGYRYLETDVHATADGVALAFHDPVLDRVTDAVGRIAALPYREVARARIGGREPIPLLADLLGAWPDVRINIDVKAAAAVAPLAEAVRRANAWDRICVASFSASRLAAARRHLARPVCTALPRPGIAALRLASYAAVPVRGRRRPGPGRCVQIPTHYRGRRLCDRRLVVAAHSRGLPVHVWTLDTEAEILAALDLGVDGIMTDRPEVLKAVLVSRGQWTS